MRSPFFLSLSLGVLCVCGSRTQSQPTVVVGACCTPSIETCVENVSPMDCTGPGEVFEPGRTCCEAECIPPGEEYASKGVELLSRVPLSSFPRGGGKANDIWGYTSPRGREYAILGMYGSTAFVEITDPFHPNVIAEFADLGVQGDMKTYQQVAYVIKESPGVRLRIFDLRQIDTGTVTLAGLYIGAGLRSSHTMALNADSGYLYLNRSNIGGLVAVNLSDPLNPTHGGVWNDSQCHDSQVVSYHSGVYAGREIAFCYALNFGLFIVDVTDKRNMFTLSSVDYPNRAVCHGGWLTGDRTHVLVNDEYDEILFGFPARTIVINVEDLQNPFFVSDYDNGKCVVDHEHMIEGSLLYKAMDNRGLCIDDISDLGNAHEVAFFDTHPEGNARNFDGAWAPYVGYPSGVIVVSDRQRGLFVLNYDCNRNMIDDTEDIASNTSQDCNNNGLPDECERDCNSNGVPDDCDIADCAGDPACTDCNANSIPDGCEVDCNSNAIPDECDITSGTSSDCNGNDIPDDCDIAACAGDPACADCNANSIPDGCEADCNANAIPDDCDIAAGVSPDADANGIPDVCEGGACCDGDTGACVDDASMPLCVGFRQMWRVNTPCAKLDPPCAGACCDLFAGTCTENTPSIRCSGAQQRWTGGAACSNVPCEPVTGACCDHDPFGGCTDGLTQAECDCGLCEWSKFALCDDVECLRESIPTVGAWGLAILTLLLLTEAKVRFGRLQRS